jgi:hypothetical protein
LIWIETSVELALIVVASIRQWRRARNFNPGR